MLVCRQVLIANLQFYRQKKNPAFLCANLVVNKYFHPRECRVFVNCFLLLNLITNLHNQK